MTFLLLLTDVFPLRSLRYAGTFRNSGLLYWLAFVGLRKANLVCTSFIIAKLLGLYCKLTYDKKHIRVNQYHGSITVKTTQPHDAVALHHPSQFSLSIVSVSA
jgi:hypothetical protein